MKFAVIGIIAGAVNGLFGSGAGMIVLPMLSSKLGMEEVEARGTTLMSVLFLSIISSIFYIKNIEDFNFLWFIIAGGILGGTIGAKVIVYAPKRYLQIGFGVFMIITGLKMILT